MSDPIDVARAALEDAANGYADEAVAVATGHVPPSARIAAWQAFKAAAGRYALAIHDQLCDCRVGSECETKRRILLQAEVRDG